MSEAHENELFERMVDRALAYRPKKTAKRKRKRRKKAARKKSG